ncbi:MAG: ATP-binding protein [Kibdelosporangium sp.]
MSEEPAACDVVMTVSAAYSELAQVRYFVRDTLVQSGYGGSFDDVVLIACEMATNALLHGAGVPVLRIRGTCQRVRIEVSDESPTPPALREAGPDGGFGLRLLDRMSLAWGSFPNDVGKVVWCELGTVLASA